MPLSPRSLSRRPTWLLFWAPAALAAVLSILWALAAPVFSVPDENAHALKAVAQLRGQVIGEEVAGVRHLVVDLPDGYEYDPALLCYAYNPEITADCGAALGAESGSDWFNTWVGAYNPLYYYLVGWPSLLLEGDAGIYAMRVASALLTAVFLGWAFHAGLAARSTRWMPLGLAFLLSPMVLYFAGSVNPQGMEIAAAAALWIAVLRLLQTWHAPDDVLLSRRYLWVIVVVSAAAVANARATGPLWVVVIVGLCLLTVGWRATRALFSTRSSYAWMAGVAVAGMFSVGWTLSGGSLSNQAEESDAPLVHAGFLQGFWYMIRHTPVFVQQAVGYFGWLDTPLPAFAYPVFYAAFAVLTLLALTATGRREWLALAAVIAAAVLVPALLQGYSVGQTGIIWQGRYGLFLYLGIVLVAAWQLSGRSGERVAFVSSRLTAILVVMLAGFSVAAFVLVLRRYAIGFDRPITDMLGAVEWQPPLGWVALSVTYALASAVTAAWLIRQTASAARAGVAAVKVETG